MYFEGRAHALYTEGSRLHPLYLQVGLGESSCLNAREPLPCSVDQWWGTGGPPDVVAHLLLVMLAGLMGAAVQHLKGHRIPSTSLGNTEFEGLVF